MKQIFFIAIVLALTQITKAQTWSTVKSASVTFKIKNAGLGVDGKFTEVKADILLDESTIANSRFSGIVQIKSVKTGINLRDEHIRDKSEFFHSSKYPTMELVSNKIAATTTTGIYKVEWKLTIKGISKYFTSDVRVLKTQQGIDLSSTFIINRLDWQVGGKSITMSDKVTVVLKSSVTK